MYCVRYTIAQLSTRQEGIQQLVSPYELACLLVVEIEVTNCGSHCYGNDSNVHLSLVFAQPSLRGPMLEGDQS